MSACSSVPLESGVVTGRSPVAEVLPFLTWLQGPGGGLGSQGEQCCRLSWGDKERHRLQHPWVSVVASGKGQAAGDMGTEGHLLGPARVGKGEANPLIPKKQAKQLFPM